MDFDFDGMQGAPLMAAVLVLVAVIVLGSISFGFQGQVQFQYRKEHNIMPRGDHLVAFAVGLAVGFFVLPMILQAMQRKG